MTENTSSEHEGSRCPQSFEGMTQGSYRAGMLDANEALRLLAALVVFSMVGFFGYAILNGVETVTTVAALVLLVCFTLAFIYVFFSPDTLRSQYTEQTLAVASGMLEDITGGLTRESAEEICCRLLPETRAMTIAVTDREKVLACVGELADDFPAGSPIHTPTTRYVIEHGIVQSFTSDMDVRGERGSRRSIPAGIIAPLKIRGRAVGALKFYYRSPRHVNRTQYALASGFAELLSTQLTVSELERQAELTARAEVRALQAQINPHFLFNTLNTIASLTRTEPLRARELLREFSQFYRATLENSGQLIAVKREIAQTLRYLKFEKARFGEDRVLVEVDVDEDAEDVLIPAFVIQPLVENAVRHAGRGSPYDPHRGRAGGGECRVDSRVRRRCGHGRADGHALVRPILVGAGPQCTTGRWSRRGHAQHLRAHQAFLRSQIAYKRGVDSGGGHHDFPSPRS